MLRIEEEFSGRGASLQGEYGYPDGTQDAMIL
jgi:hypothetical protein